MEGIHILRRQALIILGNAFIPAILIAITHAEPLAVSPPVTRSGLFDGQIKPRIYVYRNHNGVSGRYNRALTNTPTM